MATQITNQFTQFELTSEEQISAQQLTALNLQFLQNLLADLSIEKVNLKYTPENHLSWVQAEAELHGKIGMVSYLIECHTQSVQATLTSAQEASEE